MVLTHRFNWSAIVKFTIDNTVNVIIQHDQMRLYICFCFLYISSWFLVSIYSECAALFRLPQPITSDDQSINDEVEEIVKVVLFHHF